MAKKENPAPRQGAVRRDRTSRSNVTGTSKSYSIGGRITRKLWNKLTGWDNPGRY